MDNKVLLKKIKDARLIREISQDDMAKRLQISIPTYSRFERGITKTNIQLLQNVSQILELDFFNPIIEDETLTLLNGDSTIYENKSENIKKQLQSLIKLLEKQQELNFIILKKLEHLNG